MQRALHILQSHRQERRRMAHQTFGDRTQTARADRARVEAPAAEMLARRVGGPLGVLRLWLATALVDPAGLAWIAAELAADADFAFLSWVDSVETVALMDDALRAAGVGSGPDPDTDRPVEVLVELGGVGGRTGARSIAEAEAVAAAVRAAPTLRLAGVAGDQAALAPDAPAEKLDGRGAHQRVPPRPASRPVPG